MAERNLVKQQSVTMKQVERAWLCFPALLLYCCDVTITLASQRPAFWAGTFDAVEEGNPLARSLLLFGPWAFVAVATCGAAGYSAIIFFAHRSLAVTLSFGLTFAHALCAAYWLPRHGTIGIVAAVLLLMAAERVLAWSWSRASVRNEIEWSV